MVRSSALFFFKVALIAASALFVSLGGFVAFDLNYIGILLSEFYAQTSPTLTPTVANEFTEISNLIFDRHHFLQINDPLLI